jgi:16S rRNA (guanine966-N2)-methyltransferase
LRIISGYARGLKLKSPQGQEIRPTSDRAREALFNIISHRIRDAVVLDLFAGTGALGFEALSRGARHSTFVDNHPDAIALIKKNLQLFQKNTALDLTVPPLSERLSSQPSRQTASVIKYDLRRKGFIFNHEWKPSLSFFDLIFLDPPYAKGLCLQTLTYLDKSDFLAEQGLLIAEERSGISLPEVFSSFTMVDKRKYGDTGFWFYKKH